MKGKSRIDTQGTKSVRMKNQLLEIYPLWPEILLAHKTAVSDM